MKLFNEGDVAFYAPQGDITKKLPVFYNPVMSFDRDLTVAVLREFAPKSYCDALGASGIRGIRAAKEAGVNEVFINDLNPSAIKLAEKNCLQNSANAVLSCKEANLMLREFDYGSLGAVDIDPFGPFMPFLDSAIRAVRSKNGLLLLSATDTAPLCGVSTKTCQRRYDARPARTSYAKEIGLRILIGVCARAAACYDLAIDPLLCYNHRHYFRLYLKTQSGADRADKMLSHMSYLQYCQKCDWRGYVKIDDFVDSCPNCNGMLNWAGPLWSMEFADVDFLKKLRAPNNEVMKLVSLLEKEQGITTPFYEVSHLSELRKKPMPKKQVIIDGLCAKGKRASGTHFSGTGIRSSILVDF